MNGRNGRPTIGLRLVAIGIVAVVAALGATAAWAASTNGQLTEVRSALASTELDLASTTTKLDTTSGQLATAQTAVADEADRTKKATSRIGGLESQIERRDACIDVQSGDLEELRRILALERRNFARTTTKSTWGKARTASTKALDRAISDMRSAYQSAAAGRLSTANSWISRSNAQVSVSSRQVRIANKEIDKINAASKVVNKAEDAFYERLQKSAVTCSI
jgi:chromosome segregation ATPase